MNMCKSLSGPRMGALMAFIGAFVVLSILSLIAAGPTYAKARGADKKRTAALKHVNGPQAKETRKALDRPAKTGSEPTAVQAKAIYCVKPATSQIIMSRNADQQLPVASLSKLVTALVVLDAFPLTKKVKVPDDIKKVPKSVVGLKANDTVSVKDLLHGLLIGSGNDCAETLACAFPGGKAAFVRAMNKKAAGLDTKQTRFYTPSGLDRKVPVKKDGASSVDVKSNVSTAREIAHIARHAFSNKTIRSICLKRSFVIRSATSSRTYSVRTTNKLLRDNLPIAGGKTGFTCRAGHCMASSFRPGRDAIFIVVLGSPDHFRDTRLLYTTALEKATSERKVHSRASAKNDNGHSRGAATR